LAKKGAIVEMLTTRDLAEFSAAEQRVYRLLCDGLWHTADRIRLEAGGSEGLRRLRALRAHGFTIEKRLSSVGHRMFEYRLLLPGSQQRLF